MKLSLESAQGRNLFTGYGEGYVDVNGTRHRESIVVAADSVVTGWCSGSIESLSDTQMENLAALRPEILILGSGTAFRFPHPAVLAPLYRAGVGVEVMDTRAACRTYNILLGEGRRVVAALIVD
jgi:uncharacterized protein